MCVVNVLASAFCFPLQEFVELIKSNRKMDAVMHARKYLAIEDADQLAKVQKACALLAYSPNDSQIHPYR